MSHKEQSENIGAYLLNALDEEERQAFEVHLPVCPTCRAEVDALRAAAADLALAAPVAVPPARLRDRIAAIPTAARIESWDQREERPSLFRVLANLFRTPVVAMAASVAVVLVALLAWNINLRNEMAGMKRSMAMQQQVLSVLADPATKMVALRGQEEMGRVTFLYNRQRNAGLLVMASVKPPPPGQAYQLWLLMPEPASAGMVRPRGEMHTIPVSGNIAMSKGIGITMEPEHGSPQPTSRPILVATW